MQFCPKSEQTLAKDEAEYDAQDHNQNRGDSQRPHNPLDLPLVLYAEGERVEEELVSVQDGNGEEIEQCEGDIDQVAPEDDSFQMKGKHRTEE